jgi:hypothetical protein
MTLSRPPAGCSPGRAADDSTLITAQLEACLIACRRSEEQCKLTAAEHEHCRLCTAATHQAAEACRRALKVLRG